MTTAQQPSTMGASSASISAGCLFGGEKGTSPVLLTAAIMIPLLFVGCKKLLYPTFDPLEPPILRPRIPFIGHIIDMIRERSSWYIRIYNENPLPICTLPMLQGKMYIINSPDLITAAMKNGDISFDPFLLEVPVGLFGLSKKMSEIINQRHVIDGLLNVIHYTLMGDHLSRMNITALTDMMQTLNDVGLNPIEFPDAYEWSWDVLGNATMVAIFGEKNPLTPEHLHLIRDFDEGVARFALGIAPRWIAPGPLRAREKINTLLESFYAAGYETRSDVSSIIQKRTEILRREGFDDRDLGIQEITIPWVATTNTIPVLYWLFAHVFSVPEYTQRIRHEMEAISTITTAQHGGRVGTISVKEMNRECTFLYACYRETLRLYIHNTGQRRVLKDTTIKDQQGREYLLKKGTNVQWPGSLTHMTDSIWGVDAWTFRPERFLAVSPQEEKQRRGAYIPFGGGKHLCPGRNFALSENMGFVGILSLGYHVERVRVPDSEDPGLGLGSRKPVGEVEMRSAKIARRTGWEDITWKFVE
ncbi:hypothetical protein CDV31_004630 [Fusarium ambrosium]|uniref:25-hydroxycholesterol 7-alpha-hydroxylase n=1 Tax=Fusarium ambrosium TaxID=131363 RepID=A0A428UPC8_9HYPO|nr:hypothetical protein CDV31_004630 [Fusarium ambrosium]